MVDRRDRRINLLWEEKEQYSKATKETNKEQGNLRRKRRLTAFTSTKGPHEQNRQTMTA